jgi:hypothetical protein
MGHGDDPVVESSLLPRAFQSLPGKYRISGCTHDPATVRQWLEKTLVEEVKMCTGKTGVVPRRSGWWTGTNLG